MALRGKPQPRAAGAVALAIPHGHDRMFGMNTVDIDQREREYFALLDKIKLQESAISRMRESARLRLLDVDDFDERDIAEAQLNHDIEIEERILADLKRQMRLL